MKNVNFGQLVTILANIGVLAGIVFVALEIRQANRIAIGTTSYELNRNWMDLNDIYVTNPDVLDLVIALSNPEFTPSDERQREQAEAYARRMLNHWFAIEEGYDNGIISDGLYQIGTEDVRAIIKKRPGILGIFDTISTQYDLTKYEMLEPLRDAIEARRAEAEESG